MKSGIGPPGSDLGDEPEGRGGISGGGLLFKLRCEVLRCAVKAWDSVNTYSCMTIFIPNTISNLITTHTPICAVKQLHSLQVYTDHVFV